MRPIVPMTDRLLEAMASAGARLYGGERVSELAHALQCAELAEAEAADPSLIFDRRGGARPGTRGHHEIGAELIAPYVPERVAWLVRMHADAKRYLCTTEPGYHAALSPASQHTLTLQGGLMDDEELARHRGHPWLGDALRLRRWDDGAKVVGRETRPLSAWAPLVRAYLG
jgi:predicted HD phosphohydrolase